MSALHHLILADALADDRGEIARPGAVLVRTGARISLLASGRPAEVLAHPLAGTSTRIDLTGVVVIPALVNAHSHLDLTAIGPKPYDRDGGFVGWLHMVRTARAALSDQDLVHSTRLGIELSCRAGVSAVGDIIGAARLETLRTLRDSPLRGVGFIEYFGLGSRQPTTIDAMGLHFQPGGDGAIDHPRMAIGLQPHAPYSAGIDLYRAAMRLQRAHGVPIATHLAESADELELLVDASGPLRRLLEGLGLWDEAVAAGFGKGRRAIAHLIGTLASGPVLAAHVNAASDPEIEALARTPVSIAYCPRAAEAFGHARVLGPHRYRDMLSAGINVCVGTDSIITLPQDQADRLSPLDDLRLLHARDGTDPGLLLGMATVRGARALGLNPREFELDPPNADEERPIAGLCAVQVGRLESGSNALREVMRSPHPSRAILPMESCA